MATTTTSTPARQYRSPWTALGRGAGSGLVAGLVFGLLIHFVLGRMVTIGALYTLGDPNLTIGWIAHAFNSLLFGGIFGLLALTNRFGPYLERVQTALGAGILFGTALYVVNIGLIWPLWLNSVGLGANMGVPFLPMMPFVGHLVYGLILGLGVGLLTESATLE
jgi:hypothetical protein